MFLSDGSTSNSSVSLLPQYAMFLTLVFLAELVAGVSGFIFRHEVSQSCKWQDIKKKTEGESSIISFFVCVLFCIDQIKAKLGVAYKNAVKNYNSTGTVSSAVDVIQRTVSGRLSITLMASLLSDGVCVSL